MYTSDNMITSAVFAMDSRQSTLWACIGFEQLALETLAQHGRTPLVIVEAVLGKPRVYLANAAARGRGVATGMALDAALSLCPGLIARARDRALEASVLETLASWAFGYSGCVAAHPPNALCLEIGGSLKLFGGVQPLMDRVRRDLAQQGYTTRIAIAPTVRGALWLAASSAEVVITERAQLRQRLGALPASMLSTDAGMLEAFRTLGVRKVGDVMRLPRGGFARRFGDAPLLALDRALGRLPDPQAFWYPPERFRQKVVLPVPVADTDALVFAARRLLRALAGFLQGLAVGARALAVSLVHEEGEATVCTLELMRPNRDADRLLSLLRERFERVRLRAPVDALVLAVERIEPLYERDGRLFDDDARDDGGAGMVERLVARLGSRAVKGVAPVADYRPERAWKTVTPGTPVDDVASALPRPNWLLPEPLALTVVDGIPCHEGIALELLSGPERIEAGWWDDEPMARDYFIARDAGWRRCWVYREPRGERRWYLHGVFG